MNNITFFSAVLTTCAAICLPATAQQSAENTTAYRASVSQNELQGATARTKEDLAAIAREYQRYAIATIEVAKLNESITTLDQLSARDMPGVVHLLLDASHATDAATARGNLTQANGDQKAIQTRLRALADQLALYTDQAAMQKRIEDLAVRQAANLRATRDLTKLLAQLDLTQQQLAQEVAAAPANPPRPDRNNREAMRAQELATRKQNLLGDFTRRKLEQVAMEQETRLALDALARVAADPMAPAATHFTQALEVATMAKLTEHSRQASSAMAGDIPRASVEQQAVLTTLQEMIASLDGAKSDEERLRDLATQLADLALNEDGLAARTPRLWGDQKTRATQDQLAVADRLEVLQDRIRTLNAETASHAAAAATKAGDLGEQLKPEHFTDDIPLVAKTADSQKTLAQDLSAMSKTLEQQANELAAKNAPKAGPPSQPAPLSPEAAAIQAAMQQLVDARINVELAGRQDDAHTDFQPRLAQGRENLAEATKQALAAGPSVGENVHKALAEADRLAQLAADGKVVGHNLYHTRANINDALAGLQEAAAQLAAKEARGQGDKMGESVTHSGSQGGGPIYSALSNASDAQRDALSLLKQEKTAPEFESMVNQYIKSLAEEPDGDR